MKRFLLCVACAVQFVAAIGCRMEIRLKSDPTSVTPVNDEDILDKRVAAFSQQMRCLVCQNETLADSQADLAVDLRREIREQMKAGKSDEDITAFLTDRYGDFVRYRPALKPGTYLLWFGPFVLLAGGLFALYRGVTARTAVAAASRLPSAAQRQRARALLEGRAS